MVKCYYLLNLYTLNYIIYYFFGNITYETCSKLGRIIIISYICSRFLDGSAVTYGKRMSIFKYKRS